MPVKTLLNKAVGRVSRDFAVANATELNAGRDVDVVLASLLAKLDLATLNDAVAFTADVRNAIEPIRATVTPVKTAGGNRVESDRRFESFAELLAAKIPPASMAMALKFARVADAYRGSHDRVVSGGGEWSADVARHFAVSSSSGRKGRLLAAAVAHFAPRLVFELGTAYGISGLFITQALAALPQADRKLVTVEGFEPQATLSRTLLTREAGPLVQCEFGLSHESLPRLAPTLDGIDLYFHDAGHTYDDYTRDVGALRAKMSKGSILFLDDIRWDDRRYVSAPSRAYEGWMGIVNDPKTRAAFEIDGELGVAMFE